MKKHKSLHNQYIHRTSQNLKNTININGISCNIVFLIEKVIHSYCLTHCYLLETCRLDEKKKNKTSQNCVFHRTHSGEQTSVSVYQFPSTVYAIRRGRCHQRLYSVTPIPCRRRSVVVLN